VRSRSHWLRLKPSCSVDAYLSRLLSLVDPLSRVSALSNVDTFVTHAPLLLRAPSASIETLLMSSLIRTLVTSVLVLSAAPAFPQSQSINGTIRGRVTDPTGAALPGTSVVVKNTDTAYARDLTTDNDGRYLAPNLPLGTYSVTAASSSFAPFSQSGIHVEAGTDDTVDETLHAGVGRH